jgi:hypothetical protein
VWAQARERLVGARCVVGVGADHQPCLRACMADPVCQAWSVVNITCNLFNTVPVAMLRNVTIPTTAGVKRDPQLKVKVQVCACGS